MLASALMLFVELALIRWTSSNNLYLVHLTNFVLLASFLGIGLGFLRGAAAATSSRSRPPCSPCSSAFVLTFSVRTGTTGSGGWALVGAFGMAPLPRWLSLTVIFLLTVATLGTLAQEVARTFALFEPLDAYRLDIGGSLLGIVAFAGLSFLRMPPLAWAALRPRSFLVLLGPRVRSRRWLPAAGIAAVVVMLGLESFAGPTSGRRTTRSAPRPRPAATCASTSTTPRCRPRRRSSRSPRTRPSTSTPTPTPARTTTCSSSAPGPATTSRSR